MLCRRDAAAQPSCLRLAATYPYESGTAWFRKTDSTQALIRIFNQLRTTALQASSIIEEKKPV